jgi:hypothetical protein
MNATNNRILPVTRWVAALVIPFLVTAFVILFILPDQTEKLFAWKIQPSMSAMMLGAAYAGGIYFFTGVLLSKQWQRVKVGFLALIPFVSMLGIATILHWDRFTHEHISFIAWTALYFTTPFIVLTVWLLNRSQDTGQPDNQDRKISSLVRFFMGAAGLITFIISLVLFLSPNVLIGVWPWTLTPLTARVMGAMFSLPGAVGLCLAFDWRWSTAKLILQAQSFSILFILIAAVRAWRDFNWAEFGIWLFVGGLGLMLASIVILFIYMETQKISQKQH